METEKMYVRMVDAVLYVPAGGILPKKPDAWKMSGSSYKIVLDKTEEQDGLFTLKWGQPAGKHICLAIKNLCKKLGVEVKKIGVGDATGWSGANGSKISDWEVIIER